MKYAVAVVNEFALQAAWSADSMKLKYNFLISFLIFFFIFYCLEGHLQLTLLNVAKKLQSFCWKGWWGDSELQHLLILWIIVNDLDIKINHIKQIFFPENYMMMNQRIIE